MRAWTGISVCAALVSMLAGACGGGSHPGDSPGAAGTGTGIGGTGGSGPGTGGTTPAVGCGYTCAQYGAACGMYQPAQCDLIYDCGRCKEPLVCGGQGVPNACARPGTWTIDHSVESLLIGDVMAIWGSASNDIFAGDSWGRVIWYDGSTWQLAADFGVSVMTISASSAADVWFGLGDGTVYQLVGSDLTPHHVAGDGISALFAASPTDVFACDSILCWHWDGRSWSTRMPNDTGAEDAWAAPGGPLWVVSNHGWMDRWDGQSFTEVFARGTGHQFLSIRGTDANHIWAAGTDLLRYDGSHWNTAANPGQLLGYYTAVWPAGARDVWAVGTEGLIQHGDGQFFETQPSPTTTDLLSLWGSGPADIWAGGGDRLLMHYTVGPSP